MRWAPAYARRVFTLDVRSLGLMRIAVAVSILVDLVTRLVHCSEHYSDDGVLPRAAASSKPRTATVSIDDIVG